MGSCCCHLPLLKPPPANTGQEKSPVRPTEWKERAGQENPGWVLCAPSATHLRARAKHDSWFYPSSLHDEGLSPSLRPVPCCHSTFAWGFMKPFEVCDLIVTPGQRVRKIPSLFPFYRWRRLRLRNIEQLPQDHRIRKLGLVCRSYTPQVAVAATWPVPPGFQTPCWGLYTALPGPPYPSWCGQWVPWLRLRERPSTCPRPQ